MMNEKVCLCKQITADEIKKAIADGANTIEAIKEVTGAATGGCKGARCLSKVQALLDASGK